MKPPPPLFFENLVGAQPLPAERGGDAHYGGLIALEPNVSLVFPANLSDFGMSIITFISCRQALFLSQRFL